MNNKDCIIFYDGIKLSFAQITGETKEFYKVKSMDIDDGLLYYGRHVKKNVVIIKGSKELITSIAKKYLKMKNEYQNKMSKAYLVFTNKLKALLYEYKNIN